MDIEFKRGDEKKVAQERFKDALEAEGWEVVKAEKPANDEAPKKRGRKKKDD